MIIKAHVTKRMMNDMGLDEKFKKISERLM